VCRDADYCSDANDMAYAYAVGIADRFIHARRWNVRRLHRQRTTMPDRHDVLVLSIARLPLR
jgi:hypothetical protein